jgi:hypothetical protein
MQTLALTLDLEHKTAALTEGINHPLELGLVVRLVSRRGADHGLDKSRIKARISSKKINQPRADTFRL